MDGVSLIASRLCGGQRVNLGHVGQVIIRDEMHRLLQRIGDHGLCCCCWNLSPSPLAQFLRDCLADLFTVLGHDLSSRVAIIHQGSQLADHLLQRATVTRQPIE